MVNTNGIRIAAGRGLRRSGWPSYMPGFEVYLQFDSFERERAARRCAAPTCATSATRALERLNAHNISTTLVVTLKKGLNDDEIGEIIDFALQQPCVRGVTFQPIQAAGRLDGFDPATDRLTLTEVRRQILEQTTVFRPRTSSPCPAIPTAWRWPTR